MKTQKSQREIEYFYSSSSLFSFLKEKYVLFRGTIFIDLSSPEDALKRKDAIMIDLNTFDIIKLTANRLDYLRTQAGLSVRDLAKRVGIANSAMYSIISGEKVPNILTLHNLCAALNISLSDFFDFDETVYKLRGKENIVIKIYREISPMSQDTVIKMLKCMK